MPDMERQVLYESILNTLAGLEERAVINNDKINDVRLSLSEYKAACDKKFGIYEGIARGLSLSVKFLGGAIVLLFGTVVTLAIYILKSKGLL